MTVLTETQYRHYSGDQSGDWADSGDVRGAASCVDEAAQVIGDYLETYLEPTEVSSERHHVHTLQEQRGGRVVVERNLVHLNKVRLLIGDSYPITVTLVHQNSCSCAETEQSGCALVVHQKASVINVSGCVSDATCCACFSSLGFRLADVTYSCGFTSLDVTLMRCVALLAKEYVKQSQYGDVLDEDLPVFAPLTSKKVLDISRRYPPPPTTQVDGASWLGVYLQQRLSHYKVYRGRDIQVG